MAQPQPTEPDIDDVLDLICKMSPENQARLRNILEDQDDIRVAEERLSDIRAGREKTVPLEKVMKRYGMEG